VRHFQNVYKRLDLLTWCVFVVVGFGRDLGRPRSAGRVSYG
jgi:hypothetical protein